MARSTLRLTRRIEIGFMMLLALCIAQVAYWVADEIRYTGRVQARLIAENGEDVIAATTMLRKGVPWSDVHHTYPDLVIAADSATVHISSELLASIEAERFHRVDRYVWEGAFFSAVLITAMVLVMRVVRAEKDLRRRQEDFLAAVSHELKSPLASLRLSTETMAMRDPDPPRRAELVRRLLTDLTRLERTVSNVLDASRLSAGEAHVIPARLTLANEVASVVEEMHEQAAECATTITADVAPGLTIFADPECVRTILRNLVHNAIRATCGGGEVKLTAASLNGRVRLEVRDDGLGFPPEQARRLFEKFYRLEGDTRGKMGGTGLGLYLVRRCADLDGATVSAESPGTGQGAVFTVAWRAGAQS